MATVDYTCECGKQLRYRAEHAGRRTKCPACDAVITVPEAQADEDELEDYEEESQLATRPASRSSVRNTSVTGKRVIVQWSQIVPAMFGKTTLEIDDRHLIDNSQSLLTKRHSEILLSVVDSVEIRVQPNAALLGAAIILLPLFGIGLLVLPFYFLSKQRFLIIQSSSNTTALTMIGKEDPYRDFMQTLLKEADKAKKRV